jgi:hypothetical protein
LTQPGKSQIPIPKSAERRIRTPAAHLRPTGVIPNKSQLTKIKFQILYFWLLIIGNYLDIEIWTLEINLALDFGYWKLFGYWDLDFENYPQ